MEGRAFGPTKFRVPVIGQGTWHLEEDDRRLAITTLRLGLDLDMTHIDTAELYDDGAVEQIVGEAIVGRRDDVFLVSKVLPQHATRQGTIEACEGSLQQRAIEHAVGPWDEQHRIATVAYAPLGSGRFPGPRTKGGRVLREIAIAKAAKPEHTAENAAAADLSLTAREIARIDAAFPLGRRPRTLPTL